MLRRKFFSKKLVFPLHLFCRKIQGADKTLIAKILCIPTLDEGLTLYHKVFILQLGLGLYYGNQMLMTMQLHDCRHGRAGIDSMGVIDASLARHARSRDD